jgi:hypothetical protein
LNREEPLTLVRSPAPGSGAFATTELHLPSFALRRVAALLKHPANVDLVVFRRLGLAMLALGYLMPLVSRRLLGPPCPLRTITGVPCPLCGLTTSVVAILHLHPLAALDANPFGLVAVAVAVGLVFLRPRAIRIPIGLFVLAAGVSWLFELHRLGILG